MTVQLDLFALDALSGPGPSTPLLIHELHEPCSRSNPDKKAKFHLLYSIACVTCDWSADNLCPENAAVEAGLDHAWPARFSADREADLP